MCFNCASSSSSIDLCFFAQLPRSCVADIAQRYRITKYPTLKLFRNGMMMKREYRGQRSVVAIADFIRQQQVDPVKEITAMEEINNVDVRHKRTLSIKFQKSILKNGLCYFSSATEEQEKHHRFL